MHPERSCFAARCDQTHDVGMKVTDATVMSLLDTTHMFWSQKRRRRSLEEPSSGENSNVAALKRAGEGQTQRQWAASHSAQPHCRAVQRRVKANCDARRRRGAVGEPMRVAAGRTWGVLCCWSSWRKQTKPNQTKPIALTLETGRGDRSLARICILYM